MDGPKILRYEILSQKSKLLTLSAATFLQYLMTLSTYFEYKLTKDKYPNVNLSLRFSALCEPARGGRFFSYILNV